jgi:FMN phosphatase YigB (HAD superfamily)
MIRVNLWVDTLAVAAAEAAGLRLPDDSDQLYRQMYLARLPRFIEANQSLDGARAELFYLELCGAWLGRLGQDPLQAERVMEATNRLAFGPDSIMFSPFPDALPAVKALCKAGYRVAVLSNWDFTLHRVLGIYGFAPYIEFAQASLEIGVEKPEHEYFLIALEKLDLQPDEVLHVGDSPIDDLGGAESVGMHACLIDRGLESKLPYRISSLAEIPEVIACLS